MIGDWTSPGFLHLITNHHHGNDKNYDDGDESSLTTMAVTIMTMVMTIMTMVTTIMTMVMTIMTMVMIVMTR